MTRTKWFLKINSNDQRREKNNRMKNEYNFRNKQHKILNIAFEFHLEQSNIKDYLLLNADGFILCHHYKKIFTLIYLLI